MLDYDIQDAQACPLVTPSTQTSLAVLNALKEYRVWHYHLMRRRENRVWLRYNKKALIFAMLFSSGWQRKSTEIWLDSIEDKLTYRKWYCGHYHTEKKIDRLQIMFNDYAALEP